MPTPNSTPPHHSCSLHDPWDPLLNRSQGAHRLSCVEFTVTARCNLRCRHCAVGEALVSSDPEPLPLDLIFRRLDEVETLTTLNITGGEPSVDPRILDRLVRPLLEYARRRGLRTQVNTNLTFELERYLPIVEYIDVLHITWNYPTPAAFHEIVWGRAPATVKPEVSWRLYERLVTNVRALASGDVFISAESMVNRETAPHLGAMSRFLRKLGVRRYEINPMYPADWAADLPELAVTLDEYRAAVDRFLDERDPSLWTLFGTFPFLACSPNEEDLRLLRKVWQAPNVTVRNCPDGRSRLNFNAYTGDCFVTDFGRWGLVGNAVEDPLPAMLERWHRSETFAPYLCYCPEAGCTGPNPIVAMMYHPGVDFRTRRARIARAESAVS